MVYHYVTTCLNRAISKGALYLLIYRPNCQLVCYRMGSGRLRTAGGQRPEPRGRAQWRPHPLFEMMFRGARVRCAPVHSVRLWPQSHQIHTVTVGFDWKLDLP